MKNGFSNRINNVPSSFLREVFKVIADEKIISFAGGLPNPELFPVDAFAAATHATLKEAPKKALQYGASDGIPELREIIAHSYKEKDGVDVSPDEILVTNGSQQGLDLLGKVLLNEGDPVVIESPTYLAAIQSLSLYQPTFIGVPLRDNGLCIETLAHAVKVEPKMLYTIPNFQNPTGLTYQDEIRERVAQTLDGTSTLLVEDDPYGEIRFEGERQTPFAKFTDNAVLLGSFSKILAPGLRLGWIVVKNKELYEQLLIAKQAADLHTSTFTQHVVYRYYRDNDTQSHIETVARHYKRQKDAMVIALKTHMPDVQHTSPEGGMFVWATLPENIDAAKLFPFAVEEGVAFVPGESFFSAQPLRNTMRLNYTNATPSRIDEGVQRLKKALDRYSS